MITRISAKNFKSWRDTGDAFELGSLTGLFGTNSSGKTSLLQTLLMLKQTTESSDRKLVLRTGDLKSRVDLGTYADVVFDHQIGQPLEIEVAWQMEQPLVVTDPVRKAELFRTNDLLFTTSILQVADRPVVRSFSYRFNEHEFGMKARTQGANGEYQLVSKGYKATHQLGRKWPLPAPLKCYGFPDEAKAYYQNTGFLSDFVLEFEQLMNGLVYLGPLRDYPARQYSWSGEEPQDVGKQGELAIAALLSSRKRGPYISFGKGIPRQTLEERVAFWLRKMDLIHSFEVKQIAAQRREYEVKVKKTARSPEVFITDVGFGVSQLLPVIVLCYYVPEGTTILLEQPEIHLHPSVQSVLADVLMDAIKIRRIQVIVESHSEHLLRRLQRRVAEGPPDGFAAGLAKLYFCRMEEDSAQLAKLDLDLFGNITNWPRGFFGDDMGDLIAMSRAQASRPTQPQS
ncbi:DUF3696 domain-containing protein [candidate division KSB1 bacterium]|nr:DUF3696 domain-containing protein [candidate division KSB1 bacterium]